MSETCEKCALCIERDEKTNLIACFEHWFIIFNRYPYLPGHLLLLPKEETPTLFKCSKETKEELGTILGLCQQVLMDAINYESVNIGLNIGPCSGGSIPEHLHFHLVPRRANDQNFIMTCTERDKYGIIPRESIQCFDNFGTIRNEIIDKFIDNVDKRLIQLNVYVPNKGVKRGSSAPRGIVKKAAPL